MCRYFALLLTASLAVSAAAGELRTWTAAAGGFAVEAELVERKPGDVVRLKTKDGREIDVAITQLSAADQAFLRGAAAPAATAPTSFDASPLAAPADASPALTRVLRAADRQRTPEQAIAELRVFHDDPQASPAERDFVAGTISRLRSLTDLDLVRHTKKWIARSEAEAIRARANGLLRQAIEQFRKKNEAEFRGKVAEATALEPDDIYAEFAAGMIYTAGGEQFKSLTLFQKCLVRDPENVAVLNNLALLAAAKGDYVTAMNTWRRALEMGPDQRVVHNVGRFLEQASQANVAALQKTGDALAIAYTDLIASGKFKETSENQGWLLLFVEPTDLDLGLKGRSSRRTANRSPATTADGPVIGSGTGFVVMPGYLLTNAHVAQDECTFEVQTPDGNLHQATRVAASHELDLAVVKCDGLTFPPLALRPEIVSRGTDLMLLGYPASSLLGTSLKATRGSITSLPDPKVESLYLYDAVTNPGNSGGPICDDCGNVLAVCRVVFTTASRYGGGIPSTTALEFLRGAIPGFQPTPVSQKRLAWTEVDAAAGPSTLLILARKKGAVLRTAALAPDAVELPHCLFCAADGKLKCAVVGCNKGYVTRRGDRDQCQNCKGKGTVDCKVCEAKGYDAELPAVKLAIAEGKRFDGKPDPNRPPPPDIPDDAAGAPIDLLARTDPDQRYSPGAWRREESTIVGGGVDYARFAVPYKPPREYDLLAEVTLEQPADDPAREEFHIGLINSAGRQFNMLFSKHAVRISTGPGSSHGMGGGDVPYTKTLLLHCMIRENAIIGIVNDVPIFHGNFDQEKMASMERYEVEADDRSRLFVGSRGRNVSWRITSLTLVPVGDDRGSWPAPGETGAKPIP